MHKTVFISRKLDPDGLLLKSLTRHGLQVNDISLIKTNAVPFNRNIQHTDWIFFSSINAVKFFFGNSPVIGNQKFAAVGKATAHALSSFAHVDFTGSTSDTAQVAKDFSGLIGAETVLFPQSSESLRTIQKTIPTAQVRELICYTTLEEPIPVGDADILVFSSPSSVRSFMRMNRIMDFQHVIVFGPSTANELEINGIVKVVIPISLSEEDLLDTIIKVARS